MLERDADINAVIESNGRVIWVPRAKYIIQADEQDNGEIKSFIK